MDMGTEAVSPSWTSLMGNGRDIPLIEVSVQLVLISALLRLRIYLHILMLKRITPFSFARQNYFYFTPICKQACARPQKNITCLFLGPNFLGLLRLAIKI